MRESVEDVVNRLVAKVQSHMGWSLEKTLLWFRTNNPHFGELSPDDMILRGRAHKVEKFIDACVEDEKAGAT